MIRAFGSSGIAGTTWGVVAKMTPDRFVVGDRCVVIVVRWSRTAARETWIVVPANDRHFFTGPMIRASSDGVGAATQ